MLPQDLLFHRLDTVPIPLSVASAHHLQLTAAPTGAEQRLIRLQNMFVVQVLPCQVAQVQLPPGLLHLLRPHYRRSNPASRPVLPGDFSTTAAWTAAGY